MNRYEIYAANRVLRTADGRRLCLGTVVAETANRARALATCGDWEQIFAPQHAREPGTIFEAMLAETQDVVQLPA